MTLWKELRRRVERFGNYPFTKHNGTELTYADMINLVERFGRRIDIGQRILVDCADGFYAALGVFAVWSARGTAIPYLQKYGNKADIRAAVKPDYVLRAEDFAGIENIINGQLSDSEIGSSSGHSHRVLAESDVAAIMFTSGSSGMAKGVCLTDKNILFGIDAVLSYFRPNAGESMLVTRPLSHIAALMGDLLAPLCLGLRLHFFEESFNPIRVNAYITERGIEHMNGTPTMFYHMAKALRAGQVLPLKSAVLSGERLLPGVAEFIARKMPGCRFYNAYGLTETSGRVSVLQPEDFVQKAGSIGKPVPGVRWRVIDDEFQVYSQGIMSQYLNAPDLTAKKCTEDGWLKTGDAGYIDRDGNSYITGRKDELIIRAGVKFYPQEIERVLHEISGVSECLVYGESDSDLGQRVCIRLVRTDGGSVTETEIRERLKMSLPAHMQPNRIEFVEALPKAGGKVIRKAAPL
jgi:acyl-CoA synthetase (AMP-forming)/AMP-acid ligase II